MWEALVIILLMLAIVNLAIAPISILVGVSISNFLRKHKNTLRNLDNIALDKVAEFVVDIMSNSHIILKLLLKIPFIKKLVIVSAKKGTINSILKVIKELRLRAFIIGIANIIIAIAMIALANSFYILDITSNTAASIVQNSFKIEREEEAEEEEGWKWDDTNNIPISTPDHSSNTTNNNINNTAGGGTNSPGNATGQYTIQLDDGTYYWYHQARSCSEGEGGACSNDARQGDIKTSTLVPHHGTMYERGCSIYSSSIAISNLLGEPITPIDFIQQVLKANITLDRGIYKFIPDGSYGISMAGDVSVDKGILANSINTAYGSRGLSATAITIKGNQSGVDEILNTKKGYIVTSFNAMNFSWYRRSGSGSHYIVIRKKDADGKYYCFNSCGGAGRSGHAGAVDSMTTGCTWDELNSALTHADGVAIWGENIQYTPVNTAPNPGSIAESGADTSTQIEVGINQKVYELLAANPGFAPKARTLAMVYDVIAPRFSHNFAIGLMANVQHEGSFGVVEGIWPSNSKTEGKREHFRSDCTCDAKRNHPNVFIMYYWPNVGCELHDLLYNKSGSIINNPTMFNLVDAISEIDPDNKGVGLGIVGWSGVNRKAIMELYKTYASDLSAEKIEAVEIAKIKEAFETEHTDIPIACSGKSAEFCSDYLTRNYLRPSDTDYHAGIRVPTATQLVNILGTELIP